MTGPSLLLAVFLTGVAPSTQVVFLSQSGEVSLVMRVPDLDLGPDLDLDRGMKTRVAEVALLGGVELGGVRSSGFVRKVSVQLLAERGGLILTLTELGDWQRNIGRKISARERRLGPPVASPTTARLFIAHGFGTESAAASDIEASATLYGTEVFVAGRVLISRGPISSGQKPTMLVVQTRTNGAKTRGDKTRGDKTRLLSRSMVVLPAPAWVVDVGNTCGQTHPKVMVGPKKPRGRLRLHVSQPVCRDDGTLVAHLLGTRDQDPQALSWRGLWISNAPAP